MTIGLGFMDRRHEVEDTVKALDQSEPSTVECAALWIMKLCSKPILTYDDPTEQRVPLLFTVSLLCVLRLEVQRLGGGGLESVFFVDSISIMRHGLSRRSLSWCRSRWMRESITLTLKAYFTLHGRSRISKVSYYNRLAGSMTCLTGVLENFIFH